MNVIDLILNSPVLEFYKCKMLKKYENATQQLKIITVFLLLHCYFFNDDE